jgi:hypothetical protein
MDAMQQQEDRQQAVERIITLAEGTGRYQSKTHELTLSHDSPEIRVRDLRTGLLVAYSSTRADFEQSLGEFVVDYFL